MLSVPLYTMRQPLRIFITDFDKLGTLWNIRNLSLGISFFDFPRSHDMLDWLFLCKILSIMSNLRYLSVNIMLKYIAWHSKLRSQRRHTKLAIELLEPSKWIKLPEGGRFDVITQGWKVPYQLGDDVPFRVIQESSPSLADLATRTRELGDVS